MVILQWQRGEILSMESERIDQPKRNINTRMCTKYSIKPGLSDTLKGWARALPSEMDKMMYIYKIMWAIRLLKGELHKIILTLEFKDQT